MSRPAPGNSRFRDNVLGWCSSHPHWLDRRDTWLRGLCFSAIGVIWCLTIAMARRIEQWIADPVAQGNRLLWLGAAATAVLAAMASLSLCSRVALKLNGPRLKGTSGLDRPYAMSIVGLCLFVGLLAPMLAIYLPVWSARARLALHLLGMLPILAFLLVLRLTRPLPRPGYRLARRHAWLVLAVALAGLALLGTLLDLGRLSSPAWLRDLYARMNAPFAALLWCAPTAILACALWQTSWRLVKVAEKPEQQPGESSLRRFWKRLLGWLGFGDTPPEAAPPPWLDAVLAQCPADCSVIAGPEPQAPVDASPTVARPDLALFFGGRSPTEDQASAIDRMAASYDAVIRGATDAADAVDRGGDFLILGDPGSGRTTLLAAYALLAAIVRGQHVLYLCPTSTRADGSAKRLNTLLESAQLHHFVAVERALDENVSRWLAPDATFPAIVVATEDEFERFLFARPIRDRDGIVRLADFLALFDVAIVDDLLQFEPAHRVHLPFTLDKLRLLCETELLPLQVIVACSRVSLQGARLIGDRLFARRYRDEQVLTLRPRAVNPGWHVQLQCQDLRTATETLARACLGQNLDVVLYRPGIDALTRSEQLQRLNPGGGGGLRIISDLDQLPDGALTADTVFHQLAASHDAAMELRLREQGAPAVIFTLQSSRAPRRTTPVLPVMVDRAAGPLCAAHVQSLLRLIPEHTPTTLDAWMQFGIHPQTLKRHRPSPQHLVLHLDTYHGDDPGLTRDVFGIISQPIRPAAIHPIDVAVQPSDDLAVFTTMSIDRLFIARAPGAPALARGDAEWRLPSGQFLRNADLVHETQLLLNYDGNAYVPQQVMRGGDGRIVIVASHFSGDDGDDALLPVVDPAFELPAAVRIGNDAGGGSAAGIFVATLDVDPSPVSVHMSITGRCSRRGTETGGDAIHIEYPAQLAVIIVAPPPWPAGSVGAVLSATLPGRYSATGEDFDPVLTAAFAAAIKESIPGVEYFARFLAVRVPERHVASVGRAILWIIEPVDTGRSASTAIFKLLRDSTQMRALQTRVHQLVQTLAARPPEEIRQCSGLPTAGDARRHSNPVHVPISR